MSLVPGVDSVSIVWLYMLIVNAVNPQNDGLFVFEPWRLKGLFQYEIIIHILVSSFCFI